MGWIIQFLYRMLGDYSLQVVSVVLMVMLLAEITVSVGIFEVELYPFLICDQAGQAGQQKRKTEEQPCL